MDPKWATGGRSFIAVTSLEQFLHPQLAFLNLAPFRIHIAGSSREALAIARGVDPDLVLVDLLTPGVSVPSICEGLREEKGDGAPPVIVLGSSAQLPRAEEYFAAGCRAFLLRPFQKNDFLSVVEDVLDIPHSHDGRVWTDLPCAVRATPDPLSAASPSDSTRVLRLGMSRAFVGMDSAHAAYGGLLEITITLPEWRNKVKVNGTVSWLGYLERFKTHGAGIRFLPLKTMEEELLKRHIQSRERMAARTVR